MPGQVEFPPRKDNERPDPTGVLQKQRRDLPSGIKNIDNTCYFSSICQVLTSLPLVQRSILFAKQTPIIKGFYNKEKFRQACSVQTVNEL